MIQVLKEKLWAYIVSNNPELMFRLQEEYAVEGYLETQVRSVEKLWEQLQAEGRAEVEVIEVSMQQLTESLRPSRYQYLLTLLEEDFPADYLRLSESGTLTYEVVNMIEACAQLFSEFEFSEDNQEDRLLRYAIIEQVHTYLN